MNILGPRPPEVWSAERDARRPRFRRIVHRQRRDPVRPRGAPAAEDHAGAVRGPEREDRRLEHRHRAERDAHPRRHARAHQLLPQRLDQRRQPPRPGADHRRDRPRPRHRARLGPHVVDALAPRPRARQPRQPRDLGRPGAADRRSELHRPVAGRDGPLALRDRARHERHAARAEDPLPQAGDIHDQCSDGAGTKVLDDLCPSR
jgi:hypothetical protein